MATDYETYFKTYWNAKLGSTDLYDKALQDGVIEPAVMPVGTASFNSGKFSEATVAVASV